MMIPMHEKIPPPDNDGRKSFKDYALRIQPDLVCAVFLGIGLLVSLTYGDTTNAGIIVGALSGYMGKAMISGGHG